MFKNKYWFVIGIYLLMQLLSAIIPIFLHFSLGLDFTKMAIYVNITLFILAVIAILWIMWRDMREEKLAHPLGAGSIIGWIALGLLLAWIGEVIAASILMYGLGINEGSENTQAIVEIARLNPIFILIPAIVGPILEELIFRKIIFGWLHTKMNFFFAALISSIIFGLAHMEISLLLVYVAIGFVFAFLYWKTKRIIVPMFVHMSLNTIAVVGQLLIDPEKLQQMQDDLTTLIFYFH